MVHILFKNKHNTLKEWVNWTGEVPQIEDVVKLHWGDYNEEEALYRVVGRVIDGTAADKIECIVTPLIIDMR